MNQPMSLCQAQRKVLTLMMTTTVKTRIMMKKRNYKGKSSESLHKINMKKKSKYIVRYVLESIVSKIVQKKVTVSPNSSITLGRTLLKQQINTILERTLPKQQISSKLENHTPYSKIKTKEIFNNTRETPIHRDSSSLEVKDTKILTSRYLNKMSNNKGSPTWASHRYRFSKSLLIIRHGVSK